MSKARLKIPIYLIPTENPFLGLFSCPPLCGYFKHTLPEFTPPYLTLFLLFGAENYPLRNPFRIEKAVGKCRLSDCYAAVFVVPAVVEIRTSVFGALIIKPHCGLFK